MKKSEYLAKLKAMDKVALCEEARSLAEELMRLRFRKASGQLDKPHLIHKLKRDFARVKTILKEVAR